MYSIAVELSVIQRVNKGASRCLVHAQEALAACEHLEWIADEQCPHTVRASCVVKPCSTDTTPRLARPKNSAPKLRSGELRGDVPTKVNTKMA